jgi:DNA mismatch repair protein MutL
LSTNPNQISIKDSINFTAWLLSDNAIKKSEDKIDTQDIHFTKLWKIVGQAYNSYIIIENEWKIIILDQHALHERIIYEKLLKQEKNSTSQKLIIPENIKLTPSELQIITENKSIFEDMWFEIELLSNSIVSIYSIPDFIKKEKLNEIFLEILWDLDKWNLKSKNLQEVRNKIFAYTACRSAIKFWNKLNLFEMNKLLNDSLDLYSSTCPHWRPVIYEITLDDLKNKYER